MALDTHFRRKTRVLWLWIRISGEKRVAYGFGYSFLSKNVTYGLSRGSYAMDRGSVSAPGRPAVPVPSLISRVTFLGASLSSCQRTVPRLCRPICGNALLFRRMPQKY